MRKLIMIGLCLCAMSVAAQPKWSKDAAKSIAEIITRDAAGRVLQQRTGFMVDANVVYTTYDHLAKANSVELNVGGKSATANRVLAADAMMDFCAFTADAAKKTSTLSVATTIPTLTTGTEVYVLTAKECVPSTIKRIEDIKGEPYYSIAASIAPTALGAPLFTADGTLIGMTHATDDKGTYAVAISTLTKTRPSAMTAVGRTYAALSIPAALPKEEEHARTFIFLLSKADSARYMTHVNDYIAAFPTQAFGYTARGERLAEGGNLTAANETYKEGLQAVNNPDELLFSQSQVLYRRAVTVSDTVMLAESLTLIDKAIEKNNLPIYRNHRGTLLYSLHQYAQAAEEFEALTQTNMRSAQAFLYACQSRKMAGDSLQVCLALLDSAVACYPTPLPREAAQTIMLRATMRAEARQWRLAVSDYNDYEHLCGGNVNAEFYYRRFISEANGHLFQQALDDLDRAIALEPKSAELYAQKALFLHQLGQDEEAQSIARQAIAIDPSWQDELQEITSNNKEK